MTKTASFATAICIKSEDGNFSADIPKEYKGMKTKVYFLNSKEIKEVSVSDDVQPTATPFVTPTATPSATKSRLQ